MDRWFARSRPILHLLSHYDVADLDKVFCFVSSREKLLGNSAVLRLEIDVYDHLKVDFVLHPILYIKSKLADNLGFPFLLPFVCRLRLGCGQSLCQRMLIALRVIKLAFYEYYK